MRHRASRPLIDLWRRLLRATARPLGAMTRLNPIRALLALLVMLGLGTGVFVAVASSEAGSSHRPVEPKALGQRPGPTTSRDGMRPRLTDERSEAAGRSSYGSSSEPSTPAAGHSQAPPAPTQLKSLVPPAAASVPPTLRPKLETATESPSTAAAAPSTRSSRPGGAGSSAAREDRTPPSTSVSERYPEDDAATFSFGASEPASFTCSIDAAPYSSCDSPTSYSELDSGWHSLAVRAADVAGNVDPTPATVRWHVSGGPAQQADED